MPETEVVNEVQDKDVQKPEWHDRKEWEIKTRVDVRREYEQILQVWKDTDLKELEARQNQIITDKLAVLIDKIKEEQKPPTPEDIQKLLNQDYETFSVRIMISNEEDEEPKTELFTLRELPQAAEIKFYKQFKDRLLDKSADLALFTQENIDKPFEEKIRAFMGLFSESFDLLADTVVIVLNPFGKKKYIDREWVQNNICSDRQWNIIDAQLKVNRVKDFFSKLSQSGQQTQTMMTGVNFQQLQQLVR